MNLKSAIETLRTELRTFSTQKQGNPIRTVARRILSFPRETSTQHESPRLAKFSTSFPDFHFEQHHVHKLDATADASSTVALALEVQEAPYKQLSTYLYPVIFNKKIVSMM